MCSVDTRFGKSMKASEIVKIPNETPTSILNGEVEKAHVGTMEKVNSYPRKLETFQHYDEMLKENCLAIDCQENMEPSAEVVGSMPDAIEEKDIDESIEAHSGSIELTQISGELNKIGNDLDMIISEQENRVYEVLKESEIGQHTRYWRNSPDAEDSHSGGLLGKSVLEEIVDGEP